MVLEQVGGLIGGIAVAAGAAGKGGMSSYKDAVNAWKKLQESDFDYTVLDAPELRSLGDYMPEVYEAILPPEARMIADSMEGRDAQLRSLGYLEDAERGGLGLEEELAARDAQGDVSRYVQRENQARMRDLAERGGASGGDRIAAQLASGQTQANLARDMGADLLRARLEGRRGAALQMGEVGSRLRGQDVDVQARNADILNRYNEFVAGESNRSREAAANARNVAAQGNLQNRQRIADTNKLTGYDVALANLTRKNDLLDRSFGQRLAKTQGLSGAYMGLGQAQDRDRDTKAQGIISAGQGAGGLVESIWGGGGGGFF